MARMGPVPKPRAQLLGHQSRAELQRTALTRVVGTVKPPRLPGRVKSKAARAFWFSLRDTVTTKNWEPSEWSLALIMVEQIDALAVMGWLGIAVNPAHMKNILTMMDMLSLTEAARRRVHIEIEHVLTATEEDNGGKPTEVRDYRSRQSDDRADHDGTDVGGDTAS